jgi:hypothetical protein
MEYNMSIITDLEDNAITAFAALIGHGDIFFRIISEIERNNEANPGATVADLRKRFLADCTIIFDDLLAPVAESTLRLLLELGLIYLRTPSATKTA